MERRRRTGGERGGRGVEENTMAILDTSGFSNSKISHHLDDDRLAFLEAVRTASLLPDNGSAPTGKMCEAIFRILKDVDSFDLIIESYQLLVKLDKRFPRVYLSKQEQADSSSPSKVISQVIMVEEAWVPFNLGLDSYHEKGAAKNHSGSSIDSSGFHALIQEIAEVFKGTKSEGNETTFLKNMLLLQYLISVLEGDFIPRNCAYQESMNWTLLRESLLHMLLGSRKIMYKGLVKDCLSLICNMSQSTAFSEETSNHENSSAELLREINSAIVLALPDVKKSTCTVLKNFLLMILELDSSRRVADQQGHTTRADGVRTPVVEIILDELIYDNDILCSFLQVFDPKWKLEIIVQYFQKYIAKTVQTRRSTGTINTANFDGILKCLSNSNSTRSIIKKVSTEVVQLLLAYAFQAYLALSYGASEGSSDLMKDGKSNSVVEVCKNVVSAFTCLRQEDPNTEILCHGKEALFTAATILSTKS
ncbi:isoform X1 [Orobanche minor]